MSFHPNLLRATTLNSQSNPSKPISETIRTAALYEEGNIAPSDLKNAEQVQDQEKRDLSISQEDFRDLLNNILGTIAVIGIFLIATSYLSEPSIAELLLSVGVELLAGASILWGVRYYSHGKKERWWFAGCMIIGTLLAIPQVSCANWTVQVLGGIGVELFGGGVLIALFESVVRKFKNES